jgi:hypothetical protein
MLKLTTSASLAISALLLTPAAASAANIPANFNPANFSNPLTINNIYFPLVAGTTYIYREATEDGCETDVMAVTYETRVIAGVTTRKVHDQVFDGQACTSDPSALTEDTLDYYAQDKAGNVWYMGEDTFDCRGAGNCTPGEGGWIAGVNGARPGFIMLAHPHVGDSYQQEYQPRVALDRALVTQVGVTLRMQRSDAYRSSYSNCLVTQESTPLEPGAIENKGYCPQIGNVLTTEGNNLRSELVSISGTANALKFRVVPTHR